MGDQRGVRKSRIGRRAIGVGVGLVIVLSCTSFAEADAGPTPAPPTGCHGLSPASAQACTADQLRAAFGE